MDIVALSDTHGRHDRIDVPDGDILVHAGDITRRGTLAEVRGFREWLDSLPHRHTVVVAGNHEPVDLPGGHAAVAAALGGIHYLAGRSVDIDGVTVWGAPWQPGDWPQLLGIGRSHDPGHAIPADADVVVTHAPPRGLRDRAVLGHRAGSRALRDAVAAAAPEHHIFGHVHNARGTATWRGTRFTNAAVCDVIRRPRHDPVTLSL
ncbi:MAG: metallophosphatase domain-containing protein [Candidatus Nanohaloarchaea archaeon]